MDPDRIARLCQTLRFQGDRECELQDALEDIFRSASLKAKREMELTPQNRIDFLIERIGVEVKVDGSTMAVTRQLLRYAESDLIDQLLLVTTKAKHRAIRPMLGQKPVRVVWLMPF
jgi:molybdopterin-biosynthesis enzyme MoeA-like protein